MQMKKLEKLEKLKPYTHGKVFTPPKKVLILHLDNHFHIALACIEGK